MPDAIVNGYIGIYNASLGSNIQVMKWVAINATAINDNTVLPAVTGKILRILQLWFIAPLAVGVSLKSGNNTKVEAMAVAANQLFDVSALPNGYVVETNVGEGFVLNNTIAVNLRGGCLYVEVTP